MRPSSILASHFLERTRNVEQSMTHFENFVTNSVYYGLYLFFGVWLPNPNVPFPSLHWIGCSRITKLWIPVVGKALIPQIGVPCSSLLPRLQFRILLLYLLL